ncbi:hypothetical protein PISMIDRAFT_320861 [Pisolithus microcarpus 441]|uniref:Uncharacterized protein n=1 Tax=Pisolithus microcarpus 441 TaxID=765257 RepID=A0A0C9XTA3_9AGAM|nr:hypothetical protein PISMIDRAFT_320861 [Pisolithus microcarpus 441]
MVHSYTLILRSTSTTTTVLAVLAIPLKSIDPQVLVRILPTVPPVPSSSHPLPLLRRLLIPLWHLVCFWNSSSPHLSHHSHHLFFSLLACFLSHRVISSCFWCIRASNLARSVARRAVANLKGRGTVVDIAVVATAKIAELVGIIVVAVCKEILPAPVLVLDEDANEEGTRSS